MLIKDILGIVILYNRGRYDLTETQVPIDVSKLIQKYGKIKFKLIDEYGKDIKFSFIKNTKKKIILAYIDKITAKQRLVIYILKSDKDQSTNSKNIYDLHISKSRKKVNKNLFIGSRIKILKKYPWKLGHSQSIVKLGDYLFISTVLKDRKTSMILKIREKDMKIIKKIELKEGDRYHISGISDDKSKKFIYAALAEYRPKVKNRTIIYKVYTDLSYEKFIEVDDHIGAICSSRKKIFMFNWDAEKLYIFDKEGNLINVINKKGWGPIQDCDFSSGKIYGTAQKQNRVDVIETKNFNVINRLYTPDRLTNEGFDIDNDNPNIFWFLPDDGFIYKTKYESISGYNLYTKGNKFDIKIVNKELGDVYKISYKNGALEFEHKKDDYRDYYKIIDHGKVKILLKVDRIIISSKDLFFNYGLVNFKNKELELIVSGEDYSMNILKYTKKIKYKLIVL